MLAVVLASGGMDSCVTTAIAARECELAMLHVSYGQRTEKREEKAFNEIADFYQVARRMVTSIAHLARIGGSSLTDRKIEVSPANLESQEIPTSYVPFRNAHFLTNATSLVAEIVARGIYMGAVTDDRSFHRDCRPEYDEAFNRVIEMGTTPETKNEIGITVIDLRNSEI